jgi:hypothetical protein
MFSIFHYLIHLLSDLLILFESKSIIPTNQILFSTTFLGTQSDLNNLKFVFRTGKGEISKPSLRI